MKKLFARFSPAALIGMFLLSVGCLVSGTFIIVQEFSFTTQNGIYFYAIDLTQESEWDDHKDDIDLIDAVGLEFSIVNQGGAATFNAWIAPTGTDSTVTPPVGGTQIIKDLPLIANDTTNVNYAQSLTFIQNIETLKSLVKSGKFNYYGKSTGTGPFEVLDGAKVIVTFSASGS